MSISSDFYDAFAGWVRSALSEYSGGADIPLFQARQNVARPTGPYISISPAPVFQEFGRASRPQSVSDAGTSAITHDYTGTITVREVNGDGSWLRRVLGSFDWDDAPTILSAAGISIFSVGGITAIPVPLGQDWREEYLAEVSVGYAVSETRTANWIETVELTNNIGGEE